MKRLILGTLVALLTTFVLVGCGSDDDTVVISERFFANEMQEVVLNHQQYLGRTIQFEGMFRTISVSDVDRFLVMRYHDGCCGEEPVGLEVILGDFEPFAQDAWVEVTGILEVAGGFLVLEVTNIRELSVRGREVI